MTIQQFFDKYNNRGIDFDNYYGLQCMDLAHQYGVEVVGQDIPAAPAAKDVWNKSTPGYDKIANTPSGVPQKGDIIIWGVGVGQFGHIAVFDHGDANTFVSFDQNWPLNSLCHFQNHNYNGVLGWLRPKSSVSTPIKEMASEVTKVGEITNQTIIPVGTNPKTSTDFTGELQALRSTLFDLENQRDSLANQLTVLQNTSKIQVASGWVTPSEAFQLEPTAKLNLLKTVLGWFGI